MTYKRGQATPKDLPNFVRYVFRELERIAQEFYIVSPQEWVPLVIEATWAASASYSVPAYRITRDTIEIRGRINDAGGAALGTLMANLPESARPLEQHQFPVVCNNVFGKLRIKVNGDIEILLGDVTWIQLDGITFSTI